MEILQNNRGNSAGTIVAILGNNHGNSGDNGGDTAITIMETLACSFVSPALRSVFFF
jgi:hypothetical protein